MKTKPTVAVIGAGAAGLAAAQALRAGGAAPVVFEKSRGLGGRLATRRPFGRDSAVGVDHGAPYAEAEDPEIRADLANLGAPFAPNGGPVVGVVGAPGMSDLARPLADDLSIMRETEIVEIARGPEDWLLVDAAGGRLGPFDAVISAAPAPQTARLLGDACEDVAAAVMTPCWTLIVVFDAALDVPLDLLRPEAGPFEQVIRDGAKPGRAADVHAWVAHARAEWSATHLEESKEAMAETLLGAFADAVGTDLPTTSYCAAHRWRYARVATPVGRAFWMSDDGTLGCCGDWRLGPTVGDALRSGRMLGRAMAKALVE